MTEPSDIITNEAPPKDIPLKLWERVNELRDLTQQLAAAEQAVKYHACTLCGMHPFFYGEAPDWGALVRGHIYSTAGQREFGITGLCQWCFDKTTILFENGDDNS